MKRVPKAFALAGHRFTVKIVDEETMLRLTGGKGAYGLFVPDDLAIYLLPPSRKLKRSIVLQTFYHELFHAIFWIANHKWTDEKLVDQCGHLLHQVITTSEY
jgi:hypothetical protein